MDFAGKRVLIMGLGLQGGGAGVARFFAEHGAKVTVTDLKTQKELASSLANLSDLSIKYVLGRHREEDFKNADLVIRNPDVSPDSPYLELARKSGVSVEMDESLFLRLCPNKKNIIGVTGTRGKTTTTNLIGAILKEAGFHTLLGGNLRGVATLSLLDKIMPDSKVVLELSSWQLQGLDWDKISPHISVITNIYPDHLNRYKSMKDYIADKKIIFKYQNKNDFLVLNAENEITKSFAEEAKSKIIWFSLGAKLIHLPGGILESFKLKGEHNLENLAAAYQMAKILRIDDKIIKEAVADFEGVPFRLEEVRVIDGVSFVNDTTSTMPVATIMALKAYEGRPIILIAGGASKNLDMSQMAKEIVERVKAVVFLEGSATDGLISQIKNRISHLPKGQKKVKILGRFNNFNQAVTTARNISEPGDVVLLSPGCASFGMFKNEYDRGEQFNAIVSKFKQRTKAG